MRLSIVIPTYNEKDNLLPLIAQIEAAVGSKTDDYELLFVDDSTDETPMLLSQISGHDLHVRFIHREEKTGLASAVVCGFDNARGEVIAVMDADLQHPPTLLPQMLGIIDEGADVILPSRYIGGGESEGLSPIRTLASKSAKYAAKIFLPSMRNVSDPMSGFFMFRREVIDGVQLNPVGWKILMEVLAMGHYGHVVEIPYGFEKRNAGESKLSLRVTIEYFLHILSLMTRGVRERPRYALIASCLLGILVDVLAFAALRGLWTMPLHAYASLSVCIAALAQCLVYRGLRGKRHITEKVSSNALTYGILFIGLLALKNAFVFLLAMTGLTVSFVNLWSAVLAMLIYGLILSKWSNRQAGKRIVYEVRTNKGQ